MSPALLLLLLPAAAQVSAVEVENREVVLDGQSFGEAGAYEKLSGTLRFSLDPGSRFNAQIVDLGRAPLNEEGLVEASANFFVLQPVDPEKRSGTAVLEVSNRGGKAALSYFNRAVGSADPAIGRHFGDGLLMRHGLTVIWVGWQCDVPLNGDRLRLAAPIAMNEGGTPITGLVRCDWTIDRNTAEILLGHRNHQPYAVADLPDKANQLTVRDGRNTERSLVPRRNWSFTRNNTAVRMKGGFQAGKIYELVYRGRDPWVVGLGLAAIRDTASFAKFDEDCPFPVERVVAIGISQTGRFLRHYLYQGFNTDTQGRKALDGVMAMTAGAGRGSFNHRFAQPSRDAHRYSAFFYPTDLFPFSTTTQRDEIGGAEDGLFANFSRPEHRPKVFFVNTGYEYWGRAAALLHVSPDGKRDVPPLPGERIYHLASCQHFESAPVPRLRDRVGQTWLYRGDPVRFKVNYRALLLALVAWVADGKEPPPSAYPRIDDGTLVPLAKWKMPAVVDLLLPAAAHTAYRADYGPRWSDGIVDLQPPRLGPEFPTLVPQVDAHGNELGGVRNVELMVPVATYLPWSLRTGLPGSESELADFVGTTVPLPRDAEEKREWNDPRPVLERVGGREGYRNRAREAAHSLHEQGFLLEEDLEFVVEHAARLYDWAREL